MSPVLDAIALIAMLAGLAVFTLLLVAGIKILQRLQGWFITRKVQRMRPPEEGEYILEVNDREVYEKLRVIPMFIEKKKE